MNIGTKIRCLTTWRYPNFCKLNCMLLKLNFTCIAEKIIQWTVTCYMVTRLLLNSSLYVTCFKKKIILIFFLACYNRLQQVIYYMVTRLLCSYILHAKMVTGYSTSSYALRVTSYALPVTLEAGYRVQGNGYRVQTQVSNTINI